MHIQTSRVACGVWT